MDLINNLAMGFATAATSTNLAYCLIGCILGTLVGVLPGIGPATALAILLPATYALEPTAALIMMAGIYYGAQYGGSTTAILINLPGENSSVVTAIDGHQMARQGRAGVALVLAAGGSFFAGTTATLVVAAFAKPLSSVALTFAAPEYFSLMIVGLISAVVLASGSLVKSIGMILIGLLIGIVGIDVSSGQQRFTFGQFSLMEGVDFVAVAIGIFGVGEIIRNLATREEEPGSTTKINRLMPTREELRLAVPAVLRGSLLGSLLGLLPGGGALIASFGAYALEKKIAKDPSQFGKGAVQGVAGPEAANNAGAQTSFIPMLTLGLPTNVIMAMMIAVMIVHGVQPGPTMISGQPEMFWGLIASMWIGNLILLILNLPLVGLWVKLITIPYRVLFPAILVFACIGIYGVDLSTFDVGVMITFGLFGYICFLLDCEPAPLLLGMVLGPFLEEYLRRALFLSDGSPMVFVERPISAGLLFIAVVMVVAVTNSAVRATRDEALKEE